MTKSMTHTLMPPPTYKTMTPQNNKLDLRRYNFYENKSYIRRSPVSYFMSILKRAVSKLYCNHVLSMFEVIILKILLYVLSYLKYLKYNHILYMFV